jgi:benzoate membrane transport protein
MRSPYSLWSALSLSAVTAGLIAVAISYAGPLLVVLKAADAMALSRAQTASWVWAISIASGLVCIVLSLVTRQPVVVAWSIPGAALLLTALGDYSYSDAIGAYLVAGGISLVLGVTGVFGWLLRIIPRPIMSGVLAGVLLPFVLRIADAVVTAPLIAGGVVVAFLAGRRFLPRYAVMLALFIGVLLSVVSGHVTEVQLHYAVAGPLWTSPTFNLSAVTGIAIPLVVVTMAGQNGPGLAMMQSSGYVPNDRLLLGGSAVASLLFAPFGAHSINLAAITAGICAGPDAHPDHQRRFVAGVSAGVFFLIFGTISATIVAVFGSVPSELITALAGVALLAALLGSLADTVRVDAADHDVDPAVREAAVIALLVTASGIAPWGIVSPFWGFLVGTLIYAGLRRRPAKSSVQRRS